MVACSAGLKRGAAARVSTGSYGMYEVDEKDQVVELEGVPQSSVGAPIPVLISEEGKLVLAFYLQNAPEGWDATRYAS